MAPSVGSSLRSGLSASNLDGAKAAVDFVSVRPRVASRDDDVGCEMEQKLAMMSPNKGSDRRAAGIKKGRQLGGNECRE